LMFFSFEIMEDSMRTTSSHPAKRDSSKHFQFSFFYFVFVTFPSFVFVNWICFRVKVSLATL
jgi:hypothetical protein